MKFQNSLLKWIGVAFIITIALVGSTRTMDYADWPFVFGPKTIIKTQDERQEFSFRFNAAARPNATYKIALRNGNLDHENLVRSASVYLNRSEVVSESDFTELDIEINIEVDLQQGRNELVVSVQGNAGSQLSAAVLGREREQGFIWGGLLSTEWSGIVGQGPGEGADLQVQLKAVTVRGPAALVLIFYSAEGERVLHTRPIILKNRRIIRTNLEGWLEHASEDEDMDWEELYNVWAGGSLEAAWVSQTPSRLQGSIIWMSNLENRFALYVPFESIAYGRIPSRKFQGLSSGQILNLVDSLRKKWLE